MAGEEASHIFNTTTYNEEEYTIAVNIMRNDGSISQSFQKDEIISMKFFRDVVVGYDTCELFLRDNTNMLSTVVKADGNWMVAIAISNMASIANNDETARFERIFIIDSVVLQQFDKDNSKIKFTLVDPVEQIFSKSVAYSSQNNADLSEVIKGLLEAGGFSKTPGQGWNSIPNIELIGKNINYITDNNTQLRQHLNYLLSKAYSKENGHLFLYFDQAPPVKQLTSIWTSCKETHKDEFNSESMYYFLQVTSNDEQKRNINTIAEIIPYSADFLYKDILNFIYPTFTQKFNYNTNIVELKQDSTYTYNELIELVKTLDYENILVPSDIEKKENYATCNLSYDNKNTQFTGNYYRESNEHIFLDKIRNYFINRNLIAVKVLGDVHRKPGKTYSIDCAQLGAGDYYNGLWFCNRIVDLFENKQFYQVIFLTRASIPTKDENSAKAILDYAKLLKEQKSQ